ncbi:hypothetical protein RJ640_010102 [Escallonia rubra]|uniref:Uncharacterized protein n=1 Tax=Escallonia rubra TaxID=112253 RepID=A0AA88REE7_9ASTE|nr:hypothetical protein RJ640_010102 [Escallonia rubra]
MLLLLFRFRCPVPLSPVPAAHSLAMSLVSATIFVGLLFSAAAEIRDTRWFWRSPRPLSSGSSASLTARAPSAACSSGPTLSTCPASSTPSAHSSPSHDAVPSPSLKSSTTREPGILNRDVPKSGCKHRCQRSGYSRTEAKLSVDQRCYDFELLLQTDKPFTGFPPLPLHQITVNTNSSLMQDLRSYTWGLTYEFAFGK